jgi:translation initiation factor 2B subunit (eIF-2B alpha/beta/delta family)
VSGPLWWLSARVLTSNEPMQEAWIAADEITADPTGARLADALADDSTVCVLGWPDIAGEALARRGDVEVLVVDALGEGGGLVRRLSRSDMDAYEVPVSGLGAAAADVDLVLLEASAIGPTGLVAVAGSRAAAAVAAQAGVPVWAVAGVGRLLPQRMWDALCRRLESMGDPWELDDEVVPIALVDRIAGSTGVLDVADALKRIDCPIAAELFKSVNPL